MFVKQWEEKNNSKLNFFSMYFVQTKEEIHLCFKNSEKWWTQALNFKSFTSFSYKVSLIKCLIDM